MSDGDVPLLIVILVLIAFSAFFSATETAYSCASRIKLKTLIAGGNKRAKSVLKIAENYDKLLSTILIGNNIVNITAASLSTVFFIGILSGTGVDGTTISTIVLTVVILFFGEITPKYIAKVYPEKIAMMNYPFIRAVSVVFYPFNLFFGAYKALLTKIFKLQSDDVITEEEIMTIVEEAEEDGTFKKEETKLIRSAIEFDDLEVGDILVPRVNIVAADVESSMDEIKELFRSEGYSRLPVYKDSVDTVVGVIHEKDFFEAYLSGAKDIKGILQSAYYTTEHIKISKLLKILQVKKTHIAIVLDEYGGTLGIVTFEDILEELVGEIWDEHDEEIVYVKKLDDVYTLFDGKASVAEMMEYYGLEPEDDEYEASTVSGWVIERLGEIPRSGKKFEYKNLNIEITKSTIKKVLEVKISKKSGEADEE